MYEIRLAMMAMGNMIIPGDHGYPEGFASHLVLEIFSWFSKDFNYTYVWVPRTDGTMMGYRTPNGTYTGVLKLLAEDKADMSLYPLPIVPETEVFDFGPSIMSLPVLISSVMDLRVNDDNVLKQLFRFSAEIIVLLVVSIYVLSFVLTKTERSRSQSMAEEKRLQETDTKFLGSLWYMIELVSLQPNYEPKTLPGKILIVVTSIGVLFWYSIWGNLMTSDTVSYDASRLISSIDDIIRLNSTMYMVGGDPASRMLETEAANNPDGIIATLMKKYVKVMRSKASDRDSTRGLTNVMKSKIDAMNDTQFLNYGMITLAPMVQQTESIICQYRSQNATRWNHKLQVVSDHRFPYSALSPWYAKRLDRKISDTMSRLLRKVSEAGILVQVLGEVNNIAEQVFEISEKGACIVHNPDRYIQELMMSTDDIGIFVSVERISDVFELYIACMVVCLIFFVVEKSGLYTSVAEKYQLSVEEVQRLRQERKARKRREMIWKLVQEARASRKVLSMYQE